MRFDPFQFYPTNQPTARRLVSLFGNLTDRDMILDASAGQGALLDELKEKRIDDYIDTHNRLGLGKVKYSRDNIDKYQVESILSKLTFYCAEIDFNHHPTLKAKGYQMVGTDFLDMRDLSRFSKILMNPPFSQGAKHLLHAWRGLWEGEIACILNAETIKNPYSVERKFLCKLIERHGSVEFEEGAFEHGERKTNVEIAYVHLKKSAQADITAEIVADVMEDGDRSFEEDVVRDVFDTENQIAMRGSTIKNAVKAYNSAVQAAKESAIAAGRAGYYASLCGMKYIEQSMEGVISEGVKEVRKRIAKHHEAILKASWENIINSTDFTSRLSSKARERFMAELKVISQLEFTTKNIYALLDGIVASQGEMQIAMMCDVFDEISRYHWGNKDNAVSYRGWKSNSKHRTNGMKIKSTRFILPMSGSYASSNSVGFESERLLADFDKVFAMLDGKLEPEVSLVSLSQNELLSSERVQSTYFDVRYYAGAGTLHFYPRDKSLIDRLNRFVGKERQWIPSEEQNVSPEFWKQYDMAEKFESEFAEEAKKHMNSYPDREEKEKAMAMAIEIVLERHGIKTDFLLEQKPEAEAPMLPHIDSKPDQALTDEKRDNQQVRDLFDIECAAA